MKPPIISPQRRDLHLPGRIKAVGFIAMSLIFLGMSLLIVQSLVSALRSELMATITWLVMIIGCCIFSVFVVLIGIHVVRKTLK